MGLDDNKALACTRSLLPAMQVLLSDSSEPGEGEHKIMRFVRHQRTCPEYDPNSHHVIFGQVGVTRLSVPVHNTSSYG